MRLPFWFALCVACGSPAPEMPDAAVVGPDAGGNDLCHSPTGTLHDQKLALGDGVEDRFYWLHVPATYSCSAPMPLLVDFHGTAGDHPEEAYQTPALIAFADANGVIVARPRSRSSDVGGIAIYRWDQNAGDLPRNVTYGKNLVAELEKHYAIDAARVYASGFSSGSNMTSQFLADAASPFHGLAPIAGGTWTQLALPSLATGPRVYMATGYRDYLWTTATDLMAMMKAKGLPDDHLFVSHTGGGHDLYGWHFDELWKFLDAGIRPSDGGAIAAPWTAMTLPSPADVNAFALDGTTLVAAGAHGRTWRRGGSTWALDLDRGDADYAALCFGATGRAAVGGDYRAALGSGGTWAAGRVVPDYGMLGAGWVNAASCRGDGSIALVGYWSAAMTPDGGTTWSQLHAPTMFSVEAQMAAVTTSAAGTTIAAGYYDYIGRAAAGSSTLAAITHPGGVEWWNAIASAPGGKFWIVGDGGEILASTDDGVTWSAQPSGTTENLYSVSFADALHGAAVGRRGTVVVTSDGGAHWTARPLGIATYLGAVYVDATTITIAGEAGLVATSPR